MSKQVSGTELGLPKQCQYKECDQLTQHILVAGCLEQHVEDRCFCGYHTEVTCQFIRDGLLVCETGREYLITYKIKDIHWEPTAFNVGQWIFTGPAYNVIAVADHPEPLVKKLRDLPYSATIWQIRENGPEQWPF